jgi:hypothetical protein
MIQQQERIDVVESLGSNAPPKPYTRAFDDRLRFNNLLDSSLMIS